MIEIRNLSKTYDSVQVLQAVNLTIERGGLTSIIGPNGAGKSTLLSIMARLLKPDAGSVTLDGMDVFATSGDVLAKRLSILRQDNSLAARLTVRDLVAFGRFPYGKGRLAPADCEHIDRALAYLDLGPLEHRFLDELSGGQRQRAFVAMVLCQDTDFMLFDEPLNNLDVLHAVNMMGLLRRMASDLKKTVVVVLHDINFASCYSDQIVVMKEGRLDALGSPEAIIQKPVLERVYGTRFEIDMLRGQRIATYYG